MARSVQAEICKYLVSRCRDLVNIDKLPTFRQRNARRYEIHAERGDHVRTKRFLTFRSKEKVHQKSSRIWILRVIRNRAEENASRSWIHVAEFDRCPFGSKVLDKEVGVRKRQCLRTGSEVLVHRHRTGLVACPHFCQPFEKFAAILLPENVHQCEITRDGPRITVLNLAVKLIAKSFFPGRGRRRHDVSIVSDTDWA